MAKSMAKLIEEVFGEKYQVEPYKYVPHNFKGSIAGKSYCMSCGLLALNNEFTRWSVDKGCLSDLHPSYKSKLKLTHPF